MNAQNRDGSIQLSSAIASPANQLNQIHSASIMSQVRNHSQECDKNEQTGSRVFSDAKKNVNDPEKSLIQAEGNGLDSQAKELLSLFMKAQEKRDLSLRNICLANEQKITKLLELQSNNVNRGLIEFEKLQHPVSIKQNAEQQQNEPLVPMSSLSSQGIPQYACISPLALEDVIENNACLPTSNSFYGALSPTPLYNPAEDPRLRLNKLTGNEIDYTAQNPTLCSKDRIARSLELLPRYETSSRNFTCPPDLRPIVQHLRIPTQSPQIKRDTREEEEDDDDELIGSKRKGKRPRKEEKDYIPIYNSKLPRYSVDNLLAKTNILERQKHFLSSSRFGHITML